MESTADILLAHKRRLTDELAKTKARLAEIESEIASVDAALGVVPQSEARPEAPSRPTYSTPKTTSGRKISVKAMVLELLETHYPDGATALEILDCFETVYGRNDVARTSLSPQLTALKNEGKINRDGLKWTRA